MPMLYRYSAGDLRNVALSFLGATDTRTLNLWRSILVLWQCKFIISFSLCLCSIGVWLVICATLRCRFSELLTHVPSICDDQYLYCGTVSFLFLLVSFYLCLWSIVFGWWSTQCRVVVSRNYWHTYPHLSSSDPNFYFIVKQTKDKDNPGPYWTCPESMFSQRMR